MTVSTMKTRMLRKVYTESVEETKGIVALWVEQYEKPERINFAIELKDTGELIGGIDVVGYMQRQLENWK